MIEVNLHKTAAQAFRDYSDAFTLRYSMRPADPNAKLSELFRECLGRMKGHHGAVMVHFVSMPGPSDWFLKRGHSLECFIKDAPMIYADYCAKSFGRSSQKLGINARAIKIRTNMHCGNIECPQGTYRDLSILSTEIPEWVCPTCVASGFVPNLEHVQNPKYSVRDLVRAAVNTVNI